VLPVNRHLPASAQVSAALQSHTPTLNLTATDGPTANSTTHIPLGAGNYGSQLGTVPPGCVSNSAEGSAVHTTSSLTGDAYTHQAPAGAYVTHTVHVPAVVHFIGTDVG